MKLSEQSMSKLLIALQDSFTEETPVKDKWAQMNFVVYEGELYVFDDKEDTLSSEAVGI